MTDNSFSLSELNRRVKDAIRDHLPETYWLRAETSDVRRNQNGHCYLEFVEKDADKQHIVAKARGMIWSNVFQMLSAYFEAETGQSFTSGLNVLVRVSVDFHELYGFSLTVVDIDPSFTLGEIARNRQQVLRQLEEEGVLTLNRELELPELTLRIAVISSPTAAGYGDFCDQLARNSGGFAFQTRLFPAIMQGERSESSIIGALEKVYGYSHLFDAVAIIRGGGATSDLNCFDSYALAVNVAQFPLPVVSGIGHERDVTVLDHVAHTRAKTPTAVAEFFIGHITQTATGLADLEERLVGQTRSVLQEEVSQLRLLTREAVHLSALLLQRETALVQKISERMRHQLNQRMQEQRHQIETKEQYIRMVSPANVLKRGYTLTTRQGHIITSLQALSPDDVIETHFRDGVATSIIRDLGNDPEPVTT
ncbi:MAG: exodeoxyribonuclease VII large subunit [Proteiniphilum sp.]|nr:exodeoxyribonuclease VII large subunit [Proteiniphilum sp.]MDD5619144.1 exodeoxyribonuclease VII large subunit [Proteiniphilum sp.]MDY0183833.1 exodeoxyribonuclease VII large subunit [Proteiniphilum sp.]